LLFAADEELWEDVHDVMGAGHETTATTAAAALYCVAAHPEVEARLVAELQAVLGECGVRGYWGVTCFEKAPCKQGWRLGWWRSAGCAG